jgi:hypothetical protein
MVTQHTHYDTAFVRRRGPEAVAEALNAGGCGALRRVAEACAGRPLAATRFLPLYVACARVDGEWRVTSVRSAEAYAHDLRALVRKRTCRDALLTHAVDDLRAVHAALASSPPSLVVRVTIVFADETSHVNALVVDRTSTATLFEPRQLTRDTPTHPCAALRRAHAQQLLSPHGLRLAPALARPPTLQLRDDLCQTWVAAYVARRLAEGTDERALARRGCDPLCVLLQFSEWVYRTVPFPRTTRRGVRLETLAARNATTPRHFRVAPGPCQPQRSGAPSSPKSSARPVPAA